MNSDERERLKQIQERRLQGDESAYSYDDIDFLLSLLDGQATPDCRPDMIAINREHAATAMRDKCVETVKSLRRSTTGITDETLEEAILRRNLILAEVVIELESLTLDQVQEKQ